MAQRRASAAMLLGYLLLTCLAWFPVFAQRSGGERQAIAETKIASLEDRLERAERKLDRAVIRIEHFDSVENGGRAILALFAIPVVHTFVERFLRGNRKRRSLLEEQAPDDDA
jgi:hypothetical protein